MSTKAEPIPEDPIEKENDEMEFYNEKVEVE